MASIIDSVIIDNPVYDKRVKLTQEQRDEIFELAGLYSQRQLASMYGVSRRLIQFITNPIKQKENQALHKSTEYYNKDKHKVYMQIHREHKKALLDKGLIQTKEI